MQITHRNKRRASCYGDRETAWRSHSKWKNEFRASLYDHMLTEDVKRGIMPYSNYSKKNAPAVCLSSPDEQIETDICEVLSGKDYNRNNLEDAVSEFIRKCAGTIMHEGWAIYEIVHYTDEDKPETSFPRLEYVPNRNIRFFFRQPFQILPKLEDFEDKQPRFKKITKDKLVVFRVPKPYRTSYKTLKLQLNEVGKDKLGNLHIKALEEANKKEKQTLNHRINATEGFRFLELAVLSATNSIGWNGRDVQSKYLQEYFTLVRFLRFERFKLNLRNSILRTINDNLKRLVSDPTYEGKLQFNGLPNDDDIKQAEKDLKEGNKNFNDIITPFIKI